MLYAQKKEPTATNSHAQRKFYLRDKFPIDSIQYMQIIRNLFVENIKKQTFISGGRVMKKITFTTQIEHVDLGKLVSRYPGSKTLFKIIDSNTVKVTIFK